MEDTAKIAYDDDRIIYGQEAVESIGEWSSLVVLEVPRKVINILDNLPSSDFYFNWPAKTLSQLPWKEPEILKPTTPKETIEKARRIALSLLDSKVAA